MNQAESVQTQSSQPSTGRASVNQLERWCVALAIGLYLAQAFLYLDWFVDDAAISFTYARNLAQGHGLVLFPGGERVEAYSNPLWVFLLGFYAFLGMDPFGVAKTFSMLFGVLTVLGVARLGRRLLEPGLLAAGTGETPDATHGIRNAFPLGSLAALLTAAHPPFVIWTQGGLEGPLYVCLLVWACERFLAELEASERRSERSGADLGLVGLPPELLARLEPVLSLPWSGVLFLGAALTRPEGISYWVAALGLRVGWGLLPERLRTRSSTGQPDTLSQRLQGLMTRQELLRLGLFVVPFLLYQLWHYRYFASLVTNTWYVKRPEGPLLDRLLNPDSGGWIYVTGWVKQWWLVGSLPFLLLPVLERPRGPVLRARTLVLGMLGAALFFPLYSDGDWMKAWRFMVAVAPFWMLLMMAGVACLWSWLPEKLTHPLRGQPSPLTLVLGAAVLALLWPCVNGALDYRKAPEVGTADVGTRAAFFREAREKLGLEGDVLYMDPDLGATSYTSGMQVMDTWGLADVPFAFHGNNQAFPVNYVLEEVRPDFIHVFGYWNNQTHVLDDPRWNSYYAPLPSYKGRNGVMDGGNYVLRSHLRATPLEYPQAGVLKRFAGGLELVHAVFPTGVVSPGQKTELLLFWRASTPVTEEVLFSTRLSGVGLPAINLDHSPVYGWLPPSQWMPGEVVKERLVVDIPAVEMTGQYALDVNVIATGSGYNLQAFPGDDNRSLPTLRVDGPDARKTASSFSEQARESLSHNALQQARELALLATRINPDDPRGQDVLATAEEGLRDQTLQSVETLMKDASPRQAAQTFKPLWARWKFDRTVVTLGRKLGAEALALAEQQEAQGAFKRALEDYLAALTFDPTLARARQQAERIRMKRDLSQLPPVVGDDGRWIRSVVLGLGANGKLTENRDRFEVGESIMCQIFWASTARHVTTWRWYDPENIQRFEQWQPTAEGAGTSFAFVGAQARPGTWTLEVWVDGGIAAVRPFQIQAR